ncbi:MAG TPA: VOC family protein [Candidatus Obscuribacterales bacterium]
MTTTTLAKKTLANIVPAMRYNDAKRATKWLCDAFGFEVKALYEGKDGKVEHAQLTFGNGMIMIGSTGKNEFDKLIKQPGEIGGCETQSCYLIVDDADAHMKRAVAAGAEILIDIKDEPYGGRDYTCRDFEGHIWNFGTYDPWNAK